MSNLEVARIEALISANPEPFARAMARAERDMNRFAANADARMSRMSRSIDAGFGRMAKASVVGLTALGAAAGVTGIASVKLAGQLEQSRVAFGTLLGSGRKAEAFLKQLQQFAASTPFEFRGLQDNAKLMLAMGFNAKSVIPTLRTIGDTVGALGGGSVEIDRVVRALGQMNAKGRVSAEEMNQLGELGIGAWKMLADQIGISVPEAMRRSERGMISGTVATEALLKGMNERFSGAMDAQSKTLLGKWSNVTDTLKMRATEAGEKIIAGLDLNGRMQQAIDTMSTPQFAEKISAMVDSGVAVLNGMGEVAAFAARNFEPLATGVAAVTGALVAGRLAAMAYAGTMTMMRVAGGAAAFVQLASGVRTVSEAMTLLRASTMASPLGLIVGAASLAGAALGAFAVKSRLAGDASAYARRELEKYKTKLDEVSGNQVGSRETAISSNQATAQATTDLRAYTQAKKEHGASSREAQAAEVKWRASVTAADAAAVQSSQAHRRAAESYAGLRKETASSVQAYRSAQSAMQGMIARGNEVVSTTGLLRRDTRAYANALAEQNSQSSSAEQKLMALASRMPEMVRAFGAGSREVRELKAALNSIPRSVQTKWSFKLTGKLPKDAVSFYSPAEPNAAGGKIRGPGTGTSDDIPAWLSNGEYVIRAASVEKYGDGFLDAVNSGTLPRFAKGGKVAMSPQERLNRSWSNVRVGRDLETAKASLTLAKAEATPAPGDDVSAYRSIIRVAMASKRTAEAFLRKHTKHIPRDLRTQLLQYVEGETRTMTSAQRSIDDLLRAPGTSSPVDGTSGIGDGVDGSSSDQAALSEARALLEQANERARVAAANSRISEAALSAFTSSGDIGYAGGTNAYGSARGAQPIVVNVNALSGYDPAVKAAIAGAADGGFSQGGPADKLYSGRV